MAGFHFTFFLYPETLQLWKKYPDIILIDCTYKTNKLRILFLNVIFPTGLYIIIQLGSTSCARRGKRITDIWCLSSEMNWVPADKNKIDFKGAEGRLNWYWDIRPTNRYHWPRKALMNVFSRILPNTTYLLYIWHVLKNVTKHCTRNFLKNKMPEVSRLFKSL
jgi:hypothetical protein